MTAPSLVYYVPRSQVWAGSRGRARGNVHLHVDGRALCGRARGWYERTPDPDELGTEHRCPRCVARAAIREIAWPS